MKLSKNLPREVEQIEEAIVDSPLSSESVKNPKEIQKEREQTVDSDIVPSQTALSKQIRILSQLNCKQVEALIADRATIKAHGLSSKTSFFDFCDGF